MKVIGIGDNVCDQYVHQKMMYPGGQALNFSVYASMLGVQSAFLGVFGTDEIASHVQKTLDHHQVDRSHCRQYPGENGWARINLVDGDRVFLGSNKGGALKEHPIDLTEDDLEYIKAFRLCHTTNNSYMEDQLEKLSQTGVLISYDFSGRWTEEDRVAKVAPYLDFAFLSCGSSSMEEIQSICQDLYQKGTAMVIATRGSQGAVLYDGTEFYIQVPNLVKAVDTLGAGDSYATAFLLAWTQTLDAEGEKLEKGSKQYIKLLHNAMRSAAEFSSKTCLVHGAFGEGIPFELKE